MQDFKIHAFLEKNEETYAISIGKPTNSPDSFYMHVEFDMYSVLDNSIALSKNDVFITDLEVSPEHFNEKLRDGRVRLMIQQGDAEEFYRVLDRTDALLDFDLLHGKIKEQASKKEIFSIDEKYRPLRLSATKGVVTLFKGDRSIRIYSRYSHIEEDI